MADGMEGPEPHERTAVAERPIVLARRGGDQRPPNTMAMFEWAWNQGMVPQADVRTAKDGVIVVSSDIASTASGGQQTLRVEDVLAAVAVVQGRWLDMDVKGVLLDDLAKMVRERHLQRQVILSSPDESTLQRWKELLGESKTLLRLSGQEGKLNQRLQALADSGFTGISQVQIRVEADLALDDPFTPSTTFLKLAAEQMHKHHVLFQASLDKSPRLGAYEKLTDLGVESFASDDPTVALRALMNHLHNK